MTFGRKIHAHGDVIWWLILLILATVLTFVLPAVAV
jgi:hypothetical protein